MPHDVFISYATEDKTTADAVCFGLEKAGIRCWIAPRDILPSENYDDAIIRAIDTARVMVVIFSSNIFQSQYVKSEVEYAFSQNLIIAPFRIEAVTPQGGLKLYLDRKHWLDAMTPPLENHIQTLTGIIQAMLAMPVTPHPKARKPGLLKNPKVIAGSVIGILAIAAVIFSLVTLLKGGGGTQAINLPPTSAAASQATPTWPAEIVTQEPTTAPGSGSVQPSVQPTQPAQLLEATQTQAPPVFSGNWQILDSLPRNINDFEVDPADPRVVYAATGDYTGAGGGVYKSEDAGLNWKSVSNGLPNETVMAVTIVQGAKPVLLAALDRDGIYASSDGGANWANLGNPFNGGGQTVKAFALSGDRKTVYGVVDNLGVARSDNAGQSWTPVNEGLPKQDVEVLVQSLAVDPTNSQIIYAGTGGFVGGGAGVYKSTDGGETWTASNKGMLDYYITAVAVDPANSQVVYAGSDNGDLFKSGDGGKTWANLGEGLKLVPNKNPREITSIQIDPVTGQVDLAAANSGVMYSSTGGTKWRLIGTPPGTDQPQFSCMGVIFGEKPVYLVATPGVTTANGWRYGEGQPAPTAAAQPTALTTPAKAVILSGAWQNATDLPRSITVVAVNPANPKQVFAGVCEVFGDGTLYQSLDGGLTWQKAPGWTGKGLEALAFSGGSSPTVYATSGTDGEVYVSQDSGSTWKPAGKSVARGSFSASLAASAADPKSVYYIGDPGLSSSADGGLNWQPAGDGLPLENLTALVLSIAVDPKDPKIVYAGTGGFVGKGAGVYKSTDGGQTWTASNKRMLDYVITALVVDPANSQVVYAGSGSGDFFKSSDAGQNWTNLTDKLKVAEDGVGEIHSIQVDPLTGVLYVAADSAGLVYSSDGGGKWRSLANASSLNQPHWTSFSMTFGEKPVIYFATDGGGVWRFGPNP